ncbi:MAG: hypothetical protein J6S75_08340 [Thermoguttaceae bacterium]|nr:hypothetical protein [Thermoguttaceae bacterium]
MPFQGHGQNSPDLNEFDGHRNEKPRDGYDFSLLFTGFGDRKYQDRPDVEQIERAYERLRRKVLRGGPRMLA